MTKFCKFCGEQIDADAVICVKCGKQVEELKTAQTETPNIVIQTESLLCKVGLICIKMVCCILQHTICYFLYLSRASLKILPP